MSEARSTVETAPRPSTSRGSTGRTGAPARAQLNGWYTRVVANGKEIAVIGYDGLYIVSANGTGLRRILKTEYVRYPRHTKLVTRRPNDYICF